MRTHVTLPDELVREVDELVGKRGRSRFIAEATHRRLRMELQLKVLHETAGTLDMSRHPEWSTPAKVASWIRALRDTPSVRERVVDKIPGRRKRAG